MLYNPPAAIKSPWEFPGHDWRENCPKPFGVLGSSIRDGISPRVRTRSAKSKLDMTSIDVLLVVAGPFDHRQRTARGKITSLAYPTM